MACKTLEDYALRRELDIAIKICGMHDTTAEETLNMLSGEFPQFSEEWMTAPA